MSDRKDARLGFRLSRRGIRRHVLVPRYYDPEIEADLELYAKTHQVVEVGALIDAGNLSVAAGHEVGKMAYGTGEIPFVRTSDIANWEIKTDPKQGVNEAIYRAYASRQDVQAADVLLVRDGTYLIGSAGLVHEADLPLLYQSHILRLRVAAKSPISPEVLVASFSTPIVQRQVRAKQFTADIIDTLGERYREIKLVLPKEVRQLEEVQRQLREMAAARRCTS